jgi:outer membrane usher protein FimD/PapC
MKKLVFAAVFSMFLTGCGVGTYSVQSGAGDAAYISFTDDVKQSIVVSIDNKTYNVDTIKDKAYRSDRNIKKTAKNAIRLTPGQHNVSVVLNGKEIYSNKVFISTGETKIIGL